MKLQPQYLSPGPVRPAAWCRQASCAIFSLAMLSAAAFGAAPRDAVHMNAVPQLAGSQDQIDWSSLPSLGAERISIFKAQENVAAYNMHPCLTFHGGQWWAMWSSGAWGEDMPGQKVMVATSKDGKSWSKAEALAQPDPEFMLTPTGFWIRDGDLLAMAIHRRGKPVVDGKRQPVQGVLDHTVRVFRLEPGGGWTPIARIPDTFNEKPVEKLSTGEWAMIRATQGGKRYFSIGGVKAIEDWNHHEIPTPVDGHRMTEGHLFELPDRGLVLLYRDNSRSNWIYRAFSEDRGRTWTPPVATDFPDQTAKFSVLRLSTGGYILVSNPRRGEDRFPLCVSLSRDGLIFDRTYTLVNDQPGPRFPNFTKRRGAQYPQAFEAEGNVMIIYSLNQEEIEVVKIPVNRIR